MPKGVPIRDAFEIALKIEASFKRHQDRRFFSAACLTAENVKLYGLGGPKLDYDVVRIVIACVKSIQAVMPMALV